MTGIRTGNSGTDDRKMDQEKNYQRMITQRYLELLDDLQKGYLEYDEVNEILECELQQIRRKA